MDLRIPLPLRSMTVHTSSFVDFPTDFQISSHRSNGGLGRLGGIEVGEVSDFQIALYLSGSDAHEMLGAIGGATSSNSGSKLVHLIAQVPALHTVQNRSSLSLTHSVANRTFRNQSIHSGKIHIRIFARNRFDRLPATDGPQDPEGQDYGRKVGRHLHSAYGKPLSPQAIKSRSVLYPRGAIRHLENTCLESSFRTSAKSLRMELKLSGRLIWKSTMENCLRS